MWRLDAPVRSDREGLVLTLGNKLSLGRADWMGNSRRGLTLSLSNYDYQNFSDGSWIVDADAAAEAYAPVGDILAFKAQVQGFWRPAGIPRITLGGYMRGILDSRLNGDLGLFVNLDAPVKLFDFPTHLLIGKDWLDFELQASPFIDAALVRRNASTPLRDHDLFLSGGLEFLVFPLRMRSFIVRASFGFDLRALSQTLSLDKLTFDGSKPYEVFIGLGSFY
jgi:hypothetical protein